MVPGEYYRHGITDHEGGDVERDLDLPQLPPDYRLHYEPPAESTAPRVEAFVDWCIKYQAAVALASWAMLVAGAAVIWWW